jgi:hypothetical protein
MIKKRRKKRKISLSKSRKFNTTQLFSTSLRFASFIFFKAKKASKVEEVGSIIGEYL